MPIQSLSNSVPVLPVTLSEQPAVSSAGVASSGKTSPVGRDSVNVASGNIGKELFQSIQTDKTTLNSLAKTIQKVDTAMVTIGRHIDQMKSDISAIVKNFPPFAPGSEERLKLLKSFNSLRQQIDALTIPRPPEDGDYRKIMADPSAFPEAGGVTVTLSSSEISITLAPREVHTGPGGLDIPTLPDTAPNDATDAQIYKAINNLDTARATLGNKQTGLAEEAAVIVKQYNAEPIFKKINSDLDLQVGSKIANDMKTGKLPELADLAFSGISGKSSLLQNIL
jgi:hypothetical protein